MTKQNGPRYSDSKDFNEIHDSIVIGISDEVDQIVENVIARRMYLQYRGLHFSYKDRNTTIYIEKAIDAHNIPDLIILERGSLRYTGPIPIMNLPNKHTNNEDRWVIACPFCHEIYEGANIRGNSTPLGMAVHKEEMINTASKLGILGNNGFTTLYNNDDKHICAKLDFRIIIEVKSYVKSFGETMRQLQSYKDAAQKKWRYPIESIVCIASPDDRFSQEFEKQGFYFMHREALVSGDKPKENKDLSSFFHQEEDVTE